MSEMVEKEDILLEGFDSRGVAQGLYFMEDLMNVFTLTKLIL
jgi:hypothetical protein